jgi:hypothetical protein
MLFKFANDTVRDAERQRTLKVQASLSAAPSSPGRFS